MLPRKRRSDLKERIEGITNKLGVAAYTRSLAYEIFQTVKSYLLKLYNGDKVSPPSSELPFTVEETFSFR